jgi:hypothetical protein
MALVIWAVLLIDRIRRRMSRALGIIKTPKTEFPSPPEIRQEQHPECRTLTPRIRGGGDSAFISRFV